MVRISDAGMGKIFQGVETHPASSTESAWTFSSGQSGRDVFLTTYSTYTRLEMKVQKIFILTACGIKCPALSSGHLAGDE